MDIQSNWFVKWTHGHDCRRILINSIKKNDSFLQTSINSIYSYLQANTKHRNETVQSMTGGIRKKSSTSTLSASQNNTPNLVYDSANKRTSFKRTEIEYAHFVHSINVIRKILCFQNGRRLFPIKVNNKDGKFWLVSDNFFIN